MHFNCTLVSLQDKGARRYHFLEGHKKARHKYSEIPTHTVKRVQAAFAH